MDAYAAGLIDGEGYIGIVEASGYLSVRLKISMSDKGRPALDLMAKTYGGKVTDERPADDKTRATLVWRLSGSKASEVIRRVYPWLQVKREIARLALEYQEIIDTRAERRPNGHKAWTEEMRRTARIYRDRIKELNRRGPDPERRPLPPLKPLAIYRWGAWWEPDESLFGPVEFQGQFPMSGSMIDGHVYARPTPAPRTAGSACSSLLPTPTVDDSKNATGRISGQMQSLATAVVHGRKTATLT